MGWRSGSRRVHAKEGPQDEKMMRLLHEIVWAVRRIMADITALTAAVEKNTSEVAAAVQKLGEAGKPTQAEVDALTSQVSANSASLESAVASTAA